MSYVEYLYINIMALCGKEQREHDHNHMGHG